MTPTGFPKSGEDDLADPLPTESLSLADRVRAEKEFALRTPDLPWKDWAYFTGLKTWVAIGLFIIDSWIAAAWLEARSYLGLAPSLALALYLEILLYQYLWYRPHAGGPRPGQAFRPSWIRPVAYGRWTPEAAGRRAGVRPGSGPPDSGPDPREFL
jgi:hypothetical protein